MLPLLLLACARDPGVPPAPPGETGDSAPSTCDPTLLETTPLRRLTEAQYRQALADLFPGVTLPTPDFPDETEVAGFVGNGAAQEPSALWVAAWEEAAIDAAEAVVADGRLLPCAADGGADPTGCGHTFLADVAARAFRRPLDPDAEAAYLDLYDGLLAEEGFAVALSLSLEAVLLAPDFLYLVEVGGAPEGARVPLDDWEVAARLALFLWGGLPDAALRTAAAEGRLGTADGVEAEARRMLADPRARVGIADFFRQWLDLDALDDLDPDQATYTGWRNSMPAAMRAEVDAMALRVVLDEQAPFAELLTTRTTTVDDDVALLYGLAPPEEATATVELDPETRAGLLTTPAWLALTSHAVHPSPVKRGVFVLERLLCRPPGAPPSSASTTPPEEDTAAAPTTNRDRYAAHTADPACSGCHLPIDGIGFGFEHYDAIGAWRDEDGGQPVDARGELLGTDVDGPFDGAPQLAGRLAGSDDVHRCMVETWTRFALGRTPGEADTCALDVQLGPWAADPEAPLVELFVAIVRSDLFRYRAAG